jgi:hypothetical protein
VWIATQLSQPNTQRWDPSRRQATLKLTKHTK